MRSFLNHADSCRYGSILYYYATVRKYRVEQYWHQRAVHLLAALDHQTGCVLSQTRVDCKTNEAKAVFDLFKTLVLKGKAIIGDAMCCQRDICEETVDSDGDYFFTVKENQPTLLKEIQLAFANLEGPLRGVVPRNRLQMLGVVFPVNRSGQTDLVGPPRNNVKWKKNATKPRR